jgi:hypothetical protein
MLTGFNDKDADDIMEEVQEMCRVDSYWRDEEDGEAGEGGKAKEGWQVMYVRLRGVAVLGA